MKMQRLFALLAIVSLVFVYIACQRDNFGPIPPTLPPVETKVLTTVSGRVLDDENMPVMGAVVKAGPLSTNTDLNGYFEIKNTTLNANAGFVKVEKAGFFAGSRTFKAIKGSKHYVSIQLIKKNDAGNFNSTAGGTVTVPNGGSIVFDAGSVIDLATSAAYAGTVNVSAFWLDPTKENFMETMPGELRGVDENNKEVGLISFGMMAVEMTGASGQKLQLAPGKPATIKFPIAPAQQASAPATIPLWSFNDTTGLWKQEGMATKHGSEYAGKTSHFSLWNVDDPYLFIDFKVTFKDQNGVPLKWTFVYIQNKDSELGERVGAWTDENGVIEGAVPKNKTLRLSVFNSCNNILLTKNIEPLSVNTDLGTLTVTIIPEDIVTLTGEVINCFDEPVQNGYVDIEIGSKIERAPVVNGQFNYTFQHCEGTSFKASVRGIDLAKDGISGFTEQNVTGNTGSFGKIKVCGQNLSEYLDFTIGNINRKYIPPTDTASVMYNNGKFNVKFGNKDSDKYFQFQYVKEYYPNLIYRAEKITLKINNEIYENSGTVIMNVTEDNDVYNAFMSCNFKAIMKNIDNPAAPELPLSGSYRLRRK